MSEAAKIPKILGRQAPRFYLGDAVLWRHEYGTEHGVVTAIAYDVPPEFGPIGDDGQPVEVDDWFYRIHVYESDEAGYWEKRKKFEEMGMWDDSWLPEFELQPDPHRKVHWKRG